ncbi:MAG TPA: hypothetical protein VFO74_11195 [Pseudolabrys sp.]|nr:hypothetical protein [Pseudolabrys sp.]
MRGTRTVLASGFIALVLITGSSARSVADDCLAEPNGPTPQGQHWYYRIDHANNGRQCWYLRAETGRVQKTSRQTEPKSSSEITQAIPAPTQPTAPAAETPLKKNTAPAAAPIPWLNVQRLPEPIPFVQPVTQQKPAAQTQSDGAAAVAASGNAVPERVIEPPAAVPNRPAPSADSNATSAHRAREQQRRQPAQARPEPPIPANGPVDHTFALLMIMFAALAIAGPALHFVERRRRRKAVNFRPPQWARVAPTPPTPGIRPMPRPRVAKTPAPMPIRPPDQTERLAHALQQLVDRLQTADRHEPRAVRAGPRGRASM